MAALGNAVLINISILEEEPNTKDFETPPAAVEQVGQIYPRLNP